MGDKVVIIGDIGPRFRGDLEQGYINKARGLFVNMHLSSMDLAAEVNFEGQSPRSDCCPGLSS